MAYFLPAAAASQQTIVNDEALAAALGGIDLSGYGAASYAQPPPPEAYLPADLEPGEEAGAGVYGEGMPSWLEEAYPGEEAWCEGSPAEAQAPQSPSSYHSLYKTELCRSFEETGACRYAYKCQFAHGEEDLRPVMRHPRYKTEHCRTFATSGTCPYGTRCRFIHYRGAAPGSPLSDPLLPLPPALLLTPPPSPTARRSPPSSPSHGSGGSGRSSLASPGSPRLTRASLAAGGGLLPSELALVSAAAAAARTGGSPRKAALPAAEAEGAPRRLPVFATLCEEGKAKASTPASPRAGRGGGRRSISSEESEE